MTLDEAIDQQVSLGQKDPLTIVAKITELHGVEWLHEQAAFLAPDFAAEIARRKLGEQRRHFEVALRPGVEISQSEMKTAGMWIPGGDEGVTVWKKAADLTSDDLRARASWYEKFAMGAVKRAHWCREVAGMMEDEGVRTLGKLKADLPQLPGPEELPALVPA